MPTEIALRPHVFKCQADPLAEHKPYSRCGANDDMNREECDGQRVNREPCRYIRLCSIIPERVIFVLHQALYDAFICHAEESHRTVVQRLAKRPVSADCSIVELGHGRFERSCEVGGSPNEGWCQ